MTTTILRPNGTISISGTVTGAANAHTALSDNSDASYITNLAVARVDLTTQALGTHGVTKNFVQRFRAGNSTNYDCHSEVYNGATFLGSFTAELDTAIATYSQSAVACALSQAEVDALQAAVGLFDAATRCYEYYLDLVWVAGAVATITYPTGTPALASSSLTATWTSVVDTDADGSSRDRYRVKAFTAAQYSAGGFDPETSTAFYDSGDVVSTNQSQVVPDLTNSTTWRCYVKVGDSVNGVAHWGAWTFAAFTTSFTTADILTVVGTPSNANARISVVVTRVTAGPPPTWETVELQRSIDTGATWLPVRAATGVAVSGSTFTVLDYEAPNGAVVTYRARATYTSSGAPVVGPWLVAAATATWTAAADWLKHPSLPSLNRTVTIVANPVRTRQRRQGVHQVIGRSDPIVVSDVLTLASGTIVFDTATDQEAVDLLALLAYDVLFLQTRPGARFGQKYIAVGDVPETPVVDTYNEPETYWPIDWVEVLIPIDVGQS